MVSRTRKYSSIFMFGPMSKHTRFGKALDGVKGGSFVRRMLIINAYVQLGKELIALYNQLDAQQREYDADIERLTSTSEDIQSSYDDLVSRLQSPLVPDAPTEENTRGLLGW